MFRCIVICQRERCDVVLKRAKAEYEEITSNEWFQDGCNLYPRMMQDKEDHLLFLTDMDVVPTNNLVERYARKFKRKAAQMMYFHSQAGVDEFCDGLSILESLKSKGKNLFEAVAERFGVFDAENVSAYLVTPETLWG